MNQRRMLAPYRRCARRAPRSSTRSAARKIVWKCTACAHAAYRKCREGWGELAGGWQRKMSRRAVEGKKRCAANNSRYAGGMFCPKTPHARHVCSKTVPMVIHIHCRRMHQQKCPRRRHSSRITHLPIPSIRWK